MLLASGGFDERYRRAEDIELAHRLEKLGVQFFFNMEAVGYHYAERSFILAANALRLWQV